MDYKVEPGMYAVWKPDSNSPVLVSANCKLTFDAYGFPWLAGIGWTVKYLLLARRFKKGNRLKSAGELLLFPAISSYLSMNFTGSSTYTSPSGVNKEMKKGIALDCRICC